MTWRTNVPPVETSRRMLSQDFEEVAGFKDKTPNGTPESTSRSARDQDKTKHDQHYCSEKVEYCS